MSWPILFFILVGALSIATAVGVVSSRQPIHSALFLLVNFITLAIMYVSLEAQFLAAVQVIIYAGGIVILILFVIMLMGSEDVPVDRIDSSWASIAALGLGMLMAATLLYSFMADFLFQAEPNTLAGGAPYAIGMTLFTRYILAIEMVAILLLVALIGALLLARGPRTGPKTGAELHAEEEEADAAGTTIPYVDDETTVMAAAE
ncbi:MAG: NADH-quinone oxidoreductase subunit J [Caldilineaceae bacterium]|nr:NADH-quinone oxidoreductase subunit J [Caldilineaceae bacterium]